MTGLLASVVSVTEADIALAGGADILDLKDPSKGALGALAPATIAETVAHIAKRRVVSATAGDLPMEPEIVCNAVRRLAALDVDIVKVGLFPGGDVPTCIAALGDEARRGVRLVAVMFADQLPSFSLISNLREAGFVGVMLDTAGKSSGGLRSHLPHSRLQEFVQAAAEGGLMSGLAGSLGVEDVAPLAMFEPDYLGFRGGICSNGRQSSLNPDRLRAVRTAMDRANDHQRAARTAMAAAGAQRAAHSVA
jgi:(5-formylfuran-3-yl)methyl phosphate synthase